MHSRLRVSGKIIFTGQKIRPWTTGGSRFHAGIAIVGLLLCFSRIAAASCTDADGSCTEQVPLTADHWLLVHRTHALESSDTAVTRAVLVVHGTNSNADDYFSRMISAADDDGVTGETLIVAPLFHSSDVLAEPGELHWLNSGSSGHNWKQGDPANVAEAPVSSFEVMDHLVSLVADPNRFPNLRVITIVGHSGGGQYVQRYAVGTRVPETYPQHDFSFVVANPSSYLYLDERRPVPGSTVNFAVPQTTCFYDDYTYGMQNRNAYMSRSNAGELREQYVQRKTTYLAGELDNDPSDPDLDTYCAAQWQGAHRLERTTAYANYMNLFYPDNRHTLAPVPGVGHNSSQMFRSPEGRASIFVRADGSVSLFYDSFEESPWNGLWSEDAQNDWFISGERATAGGYAAKVDGSATDAALASKEIGLSGATDVTVSFDWFIERRLDTNEYLAFDVSTDGGSSWVEMARLRGNVDAEDTWHAEQFDLDVRGASGLRLRFRGRMSKSNEDANVDNVRVVAAAATEPPTGQPPAAAFAFNCVDLACDFVDLSAAGDSDIVTHAWAFGDGGTSAARNPLYSYANAGTYTVTLTVIDVDGAMDATSRDVSVTAPNALPSAAFSVSTAGLTASFSDASTDSDGSIIQWSWNFGDGSGATGPNPSHAYAAAGTYSVTLTVTDNDGGVASITDGVTVDLPGGGSPEAFSDSFEDGAWNGLWTEDAQNDWFVSGQRATAGDYAAEVDGRATDATLTSTEIELNGATDVTVSFDWYIERGFDNGEYLAFDVSTDGGSSWVEITRLRGNDDEENTWHAAQFDLDVRGASSLRLRFRGLMSQSHEDANVDNVVVTPR